MNKTILSLGGVVILALLLMVGVVNSQSGQTEQVREPRVALERFQVATTSMDITVRGMVLPSESAIIRAQTAGIVNDVLVSEGARVARGQLLLQQSTPVVAAQAGLRSAEQLLGTSQREQAAAGSQASLLQSKAALTYQAERQTIELPAAKRRLAEFVTGTQRDLVAARTDVINVLEYIANNRSAFSADALTRERDVQEMLYARTPSYLTRVLLPRSNQGAADWFANEQYGSTVRTADEVLADVQQALGAAEQLQLIINSAEDYYLDARTVAIDSAEYEMYFTRRDEVATLVATLEQRTAGLTSQIDTVQILDTTLAGTEAITGAEAAGAAAVAEWSETVVDAGTGVARAVEAVSAAELSLARSQAPYTGVVTQLHVERGEYVTPGAPLLTLVGAGAREIEVQVPRALIPFIAVGAPYTVPGKVLGAVDRIVTEDVRGVARVYISLTTADDIAVGDVVEGKITFTVPMSAGQVVPRTHLWFGTLGPYVTTTDGLVSVTILYDAGAQLLVAAERDITTLWLEPVTTVAW